MTNPSHPEGPMTSTCRWVASDQPRILPGRHAEDCRGVVAFRGEADYDECPGCLPCTEPHCTVCRRVHADGSCAECLAETRDGLNTIRRICGVLPVEATQRGINGEAMMLNGPAANAEAWSNRHMSALRGRLCKCASRGQVCPAYYDRMCPDAAAYLEDARDELHPLWVLGGWENLWRDVLDHPSGLRQTIARAADYIDRHMHEMARAEEPDFGQFATEIRHCRAHLEAVVHDERQGDVAGVGCFECGGKLERKLTERDGFEDVWTCNRCHRRYTYAEYNFALRAHLEAAKETA